MENEDSLEQRGNLGEWSELYTLAYLLVNGGAYGADAKLLPLPELFYRTLSIFVADKGPDEEIEYRLIDDQVEVIRESAEPKLLPFDIVSRLFGDFKAELLDGVSSKTFSIIAGSKLLQLLEKTRLSADSTQTTSDLDLVIVDHETGLRSPRIGFSIKSQLGSPSTLLNAGKTTNFIFKLKPPHFENEATGHIQPALLETTDEKISVKSEVKRVLDAGYSFEFQRVESLNFQQNLELVDSQMPQFLADALVQSYAGKTSKFSEVAAQTFRAVDQASKQRIFKLKQFLGAVAMGLRPSLYWDGDVTKFKGLILVTAIGDVVFYYLYNLTNFQDFLYESVKFEIASTSRHQFGRIYKDGEDYFMKLNLQIRFIS